MNYRLLTFLLSAVCWAAHATNVTIDLKDATLNVSVYSNRTLYIDALSTPTISSPSVVMNQRLIFVTDTNGVVILTNLYTGLYHVLVTAPPQLGQFSFLVTDTNLGNIYAADNLVASAASTFPAGQVAWAAAVTDERYGRNTNQPVSFNQVSNALGYIPQFGSVNLTNWSALPTNTLGSLAYIANNNGSGTNPIIDYPSSSIYSTFIHPYSTTGVELLYQNNDLSQAVMLWRSIGSQLYINQPIITSGTFNGTSVGTFAGDGSGLTNLPAPNLINATNNDLLAGLAATNNDLAVSNNLKAYVDLGNLATAVGLANATNNDLQLGQNATNEVARAGLTYISRDTGFGTNTSLLNPSLTNGVNYGNAFSSPNSAISGSEQFGATASASGGFSTAVGYGAIAKQTASVAIGNTATATNLDATALGTATTSGSQNATAIGFEAAATVGNSATAVGAVSSASASFASAFGPAALSAFSSSTALGYLATVTQAHQIMLGTGNEYVSAPGGLSASGITNLNAIASRIAVYDANQSIGTLANGGNNTLLHGTSPPAYSAVVETDLSLSDVTTADSSTSQHGFLKKLDNTATHYMDGTGNWSTPSGSGGSGTVTSVGLSMPSEFTVSGSPVTSSGTLSVTKASQLQNTIYAGPTSGTGPPTFRALGTEDNVWLQSGNANVSGAGGFLGTTDNENLLFKANNVNNMTLGQDSLVVGSLNSVVPGGNVAIGGTSARLQGTPLNSATLGGYLVTINASAFAGSVSNSVLAGGNDNSIAPLVTVAANSAIVGGTVNALSGNQDFIGAGHNNTVQGDNNAVFGTYGKTTHNTSFVFSDSSSTTPFADAADNSFNIRATGGIVVQTGGTGLNVDGPGTFTTLHTTSSAQIDGVTTVNRLTATNGVASTVNAAAAPTAIVFPGTTATWTNTQNYSILLYIDNSGVTGTIVKKNGTQIFGGLVNDITIGLKPGDYFSETYTIGSPSARYEMFP